MIRLLPLIALLSLPGCLTAPPAPVDNPARYAPTDAPVPNAVRILLPRGVTARDVRVSDNCYGYVYGGAVYPVLIPRGTQYCI
ncbi:MAG: hypothetical protein WBA25_13570 [Jannaschia sp.]